MKIFRLTLFCAAFFLLKESVIAQPEYSFKNNINVIVQDTAGNIDSTRRAKSRQFWKEFWEDYAPAVEVSGGFHTEMTVRKRDLIYMNEGTLGIGPAWKAVIDFPFDKNHYFNWEFSYYMMYGRDSLDQMITTGNGSLAGMRIYLQDRHTLLRPHIGWALAGVDYIVPFFNVNAGLDYSINPSLSAHFSIENLYSYAKSLNHHGTYDSYAAFLGVRYQL